MATPIDQQMRGKLCFFIGCVVASGYTPVIASSSTTTTAEQSEAIKTEVIIWLTITTLLVIAVGVQVVLVTNNRYFTCSRKPTTTNNKKKGHKELKELTKDNGKSSGNDNDTDTDSESGSDYEMIDEKMINEHKKKLETKMGTPTKDVDTYKAVDVDDDDDDGDYDEDEEQPNYEEVEIPSSAQSLPQPPPTPPTPTPTPPRTTSPLPRPASYPSATPPAKVKQIQSNYDDDDDDDDEEEFDGFASVIGGGDGGGGGGDGDDTQEASKPLLPPVAPRQLVIAGEKQYASLTEVKATGYVNAATIAQLMSKLKEDTDVLPPAPDETASKIPPAEWSPIDCLEWLVAKGFDDFHELFYSNGFEGFHLVALQLESFEGIKSVPLQRCEDLVTAIEELKANGGWEGVVETVATAKAEEQDNTVTLQRNRRKEISEDDRIKHCLALPNLTRDTGREVLIGDNGGDVGEFLVRKGRTGGDVIQVVAARDKVLNLNITEENGQFVTSDGLRFPLLPQLLDHLRNKQTGGLPVKLKQFTRAFDGDIRQKQRYVNHEVVNRHSSAF